MRHPRSMRTGERGWWALGGGLALLLASATAVGQQRCPAGQVRTSSGCQRVDGRRPPAPAAGGGCPPGMVSIAAGEFLMGSPDGEHPRRRVRVAAFCLDVTEVTVSAYRACTSAGRCTEPDAYQPPPDHFHAFCNWGRDGRETHPLNCVTWDRARSYCAWTGGRLPREREWEYAARGREGRRYPWGDAEPDSSRANLCGTECAEAYRVAGTPGLIGIPGWTDAWGWTAPVGSFPAGNTPEGLRDMAGNVQEWMEDLWYWPGSRPGEPRQPNRVTRGGAWRDTDFNRVRAASRDATYPPNRNMTLGFRCARDLH